MASGGVRGAAGDTHRYATTTIDITMIVSATNNYCSSLAMILNGRMPPVNLDMCLLKSKFFGRFTIPCEDSEESKYVVRTLSGRANANRRKTFLHYKGNTETPTYDISFWLPPDSEAYKTPDQWQKSPLEFASSVRSNVRYRVRQTGK